MKYSVEPTNLHRPVIGGNSLYYFEMGQAPAASVSPTVPPPTWNDTRKLDAGHLEVGGLTRGFSLSTEVSGFICSVDVAKDVFINERYKSTSPLELLCAV